MGEFSCTQDRTDEKEAQSGEAAKSEASRIEPAESPNREKTGEQKKNE
jgi:hypothetical protein